VVLMAQALHGFAAASSGLLWAPPGGLMGPAGSEICRCRPAAGEPGCGADRGLVPELRLGLQSASLI